MKPRNLEKGTFVLFGWVDSSSSFGWMTVEDSGVPSIQSLGIVVSVSSESLTVSTSLADDGDCIDPLNVPWCAIRNLKVIEVIDSVRKGN